MNFLQGFMVTGLNRDNQTLTGDLHTTHSGLVWSNLQQHFSPVFYTDMMMHENDKESILFDIWKIVWVPHNLWKWNPSLLLYRKVRTRLNDYELVVEENHSRDAIEWNGNIAYLFFARTLYFIHCEKNKATKTNNKPTMITIGLILRPAFGQRKRLRNFFASSEPW
jgi:hypothetical protein